MDDKQAVAARLFMEHFGGPHSRLILKDCIKIAILEMGGTRQDPAGELDNIAAASVVAIMGQIEEWAGGRELDRLADLARMCGPLSDCARSGHVDRAPGESLEDHARLPELGDCCEEDGEAEFQRRLSTTDVPHSYRRPRPDA